MNNNKNNFKTVLLLIFIFYINISKSSKERIDKNHNEYDENGKIKDIKGYFKYETIESSNKIQFKKLSYSKHHYDIEKELIMILEKGMNFQFLIDNKKNSIVQATIKNCCAHYNIENCSIEINSIYQPIPSQYSNSIIEKETHSPNSDSFQYFKFEFNESLNNNDGKNIKRFESLRTNKFVSIDFNSIKSPYRYLSGFDNQWYDSDIGLKNTIYLFDLKSHGTYNQPNKYNHVYYNQELLLIYSKVEFCYSQFPEPSGYDPYFIVKRNRIYNTTKCSPPTGVVIALNCHYVQIPQCQYGLSFISYNDPHLYCPIYSCDIPIHYYN
ncbi:hypothetical protein RB653_004341 [Dictyostelium firmibasis]|uniref:Uncharacterized protein n=1 Tax=Dictyostelium firmibasis TaxID=79012 RepID=A0AAN7Z394_9MYCE